MKRTKLLLTMVLFLILCMMGMTSVAAAVYAAGDGEEDGEVAAEEADPAVDFNKNPDNTGFGTAGMSAPKRHAKTMSSWQGSYVYYGKDKGGRKLKYHRTWCLRAVNRTSPSSMNI